MADQSAVEFLWRGNGDIPDESLRPTPAENSLPMWFQMLETYVGDSNSKTAKLCSTFGDGFRIGYLLPITYSLTAQPHADGVDRESDRKGIRWYGRGTVAHNGRETHRPPDACLPLDWGVETPEGYSTLFLPPTNRWETGIRPYSMLVPTDEYQGIIPIPVSFDRDGAEASAGDPLVQAIPVHRDGLLQEFSITSESENPETYERMTELYQKDLAADGYYRRYAWEPKPSSTVDLEAEPESGSDNGDHSRKDDLPDPDQFTPEHPARTITSDINYGVLPEPYPVAERTPPWIENEQPAPENGEIEELYMPWVKSVMNYGMVSPVIAEGRIEVTEDGIEFFDSYDGHFPHVGIHTGNSGWDQDTLLSEHPRAQLGEWMEGNTGAIVKIGSAWYTLLPNGYSMLVRDPFNYRMERLRSWTGFADGDNFPIQGNSILYLDGSTKELNLSAGDPVAMQLPIHRDAILRDAVIKQK